MTSTVKTTETASAPDHAIRLTYWITGLALVLLTLLWNYRPVLVDLLRDWRRDPDYSIGQLVPFVVLYLAWAHRHRFKSCRIKPAWWGIALILLAQVVRVYGLLFLLESAQRYALVLTLAGIVLLLAGWQVFYRARWLLLFLLLMVPLPGRVHNVISYPLQNLATTGAVFSLELFGISVVREGNVIVLNNQVPIAIVEACSGLRMLTAFVVISATLAFLVRRPPWQKVLLLASGIPIAIFCNLVRLSVTAVLYLNVSNEIAEKFFHDFAGLTMMPLAVLILLGEIYLLNKLVIPESPPFRRRRPRRISTPSQTGKSSGSREPM